MAKLLDIKRVLVEDFPDQEWIGKLAPIINKGFETLSEAVRGRLTIADNLAGQVVETINSWAAGVTQALQFTATLTGGTVPRGIHIWQALDVTTGSTPVSIPAFSWIHSGTLVTVTFTGNPFTIGNKYKFTIAVYGG